MMSNKLRSVALCHFVVALCTVSWSVSSVMSAEIVHRFDFEDETGDDSVGGLAGTLNGGPTFSSDAKSGSASLLLEGDQYVRIDDPMDFGSQFSIFMWVKPDTTALGIQNLIGNAPGGWDTDGFKLYYNTWSDPATADGAFLLETGDGVGIGSAGDAVRSDPDLIIDDEWYHVGTTIDIDSAEALLYVNGELLFTGGGLNVDMKTDSPFEIGRMLNDWDLHGFVDDVQIYSGVLTDEEVLSLFENPGSAIGLPDTKAGDYNRDGSVNVADIDLQAQAMQMPNPNLSVFDENKDGFVNVVDREIWVSQHADTWMGDANFDSEFNSADFIATFLAGEYEDGDNNNSTWAEGDWNGDLDFTTADFVTAFLGGGYELGPRPAVTAVPEPSAVVLMLLGVSSIAVRRCRRPAEAL